MKDLIYLINANIRPVIEYTHQKTGAQIQLLKEGVWVIRYRANVDSNWTIRGTYVNDIRSKKYLTDFNKMCKHLEEGVQINQIRLKRVSTGDI